MPSTTPTSTYASIIEVHVKFGPNPCNPLVQEKFSVNYGDVIPDYGCLLVDPSVRDELLKEEREGFQK